MSVIQISEMQHRKGKSGELPNELAEGEIGFTTDTGEIFMGMPNLPRISGRQTYPYKNAKILTEFDVQYTVTGDVYNYGPLKVKRILPGTTVSNIPLHEHYSRDFLSYDFSLSKPNKTSKLMGKINIVVNSVNLELSEVTMSDITKYNWTASDPIADNFSLSLLDSNGTDSGITWLKCINNFTFSDGVSDIILTISGKEWSSPLL